jgi:hypothetical protein
MPNAFTPLSRQAKKELEKCVMAGLTASETRRRLAGCGTKLPYKTVCAHVEQVAADLQALGEMDAGGLSSLLEHYGGWPLPRQAVPFDFRTELARHRRWQTKFLLNLFQHFLRNPTAGMLLALMAGIRAYFSYAASLEALQTRDA